MRYLMYKDNKVVEFDALAFLKSDEIIDAATKRLAERLTKRKKIKEVMNEEA